MRWRAGDVTVECFPSMYEAALGLNPRHGQTKRSGSYTSNPSTAEVEPGGLEIQGRPPGPRIFETLSQEGENVHSEERL